MTQEKIFEDIKEKWVAEAILVGFSKEQALFLYEKIRMSVWSGGIF